MAQNLRPNLDQLFPQRCQCPVTHLIETKEFYVWDKIADKPDRNEQAVEQMYSSESDAWVKVVQRLGIEVRRHPVRH